GRWVLALARGVPEAVPSVVLPPSPPPTRPLSRDARTVQRPTRDLVSGRLGSERVPFGGSCEGRAAAGKAGALDLDPRPMSRVGIGTRVWAPVGRAQAVPRPAKPARQGLTPPAAVIRHALARR